MNREFLKGLGLDDAAIDKIMGEHGKTLQSQATKVTELTTSLNDIKAQLSQRDKDLTDLKKQAEGNAELQKKFTDLETQYKNDKAAYESKIKDTQMASALKLALAGKVHDTDLVAGLIDKTKIELGEDGSVKKGLDEQIKSLQESKSFLFVPGAPGIKGATPPGGNSSGGGAGGGDASGGANFAKMANERSKPVETKLWG